MIHSGRIHRTDGVHEEGKEALHCGDAAGGVGESTRAFDHWVVSTIVDGDTAVYGGAGAKLAADVPFIRRSDLPSSENGVQRTRCQFIFT